MEKNILKSMKNYESLSNELMAIVQAAKPLPMTNGKIVFNKDIPDGVRVKLEFYDFDRNYVLTHTCPTDWQPVDLFMRGLDQSKVDSTMEEYLDDVLRYIGGYDYWYFGHYHYNCPVDEKHGCLYQYILHILF